MGQRFKKLTFRSENLYSNILCFKSTDEDQTETLSEEKLLEIIESAYPNPVVVKDVAK